MHRIRCLFFGAFAACCTPAHGWDAAAHEIIDTIAVDHLNEKARQAVSDLARALPTPGTPFNSITIGCWMDDLRRNDLALPDHGRFLSWHYIDIGIDPGDPVPAFEPGDDNEFKGNVVQALKRARVVLEGGSDPYVRDKAMACAMTMHLVGDIHQPLHAATHYFQTAGGWTHHDAGGNKEYLLNGPANDPHFNLHRFWDCAWRASFDDATGEVVLDPRFEEPTRSDPQAIQSVAREVERMPPPTGDLKPHFDQWARESNQIARDFVYREITATDNKKYCRLSSGYVAHAREVARQRLLLSAYRLAFLLNETLGAATAPTPPASYPAGPPGHPY